MSVVGDERKWISVSLWVLLLVGVALRLQHYLGDRSLWVDEAMVSLSIIHLSVPQLFGQLEYLQIAPIGFLLLAKLSVWLFGPVEMALRAPALVFGLCGLCGYFWLVRRIFKQIVAVVVFALFALSTSLIYYSAEVKPYGIDAALTVAVMIATYLLMEQWTPRRLYGFGALSVIAVWLSFTAIFVIAAVGIVLLVHCLMHMREQLWRVLAIGAAIMISFALSYYAAAAHASDVVHAMQDEFWWRDFMPLNGSGLSWLIAHFVGMFEYPGGFKFPQFALFLAIAGAIWMWRDHSFWSILLAAVLVITLVASGLRMYPFTERFLLFLLPLLLLALGYGLVVTVIKTKPTSTANSLEKAVPVLVVLFVVAMPLRDIINNAAMSAPYEREDIKSVLEFVQDRREADDIIYVYHGGIPAYIYYRERYGLADFYATKDRAHYRDDISRLDGRGRVWLIFAHQQITLWRGQEQEMLDVADELGQLVEQRKAKGAAAYVYNFGTDQVDKPIELDLVPPTAWSVLR